MRVLAAMAACALLSSGCSVLSGNDDAREREALRLAIVRPRTLDPIRAATVEEQLVAEQLFDSLVALDASTAQPRPGIAASWTTSGDGLVWDFTLDEDATFSDGAPVTAADVKATYDRAVRKDSGSAVADLLEPVAGWRDVAIAGTAEGLPGVTVVDDTTVRITLDSPWASLPSALAHPGLGIVPTGAAARPPGDPEIGSGPYVVRTRSESRIVLRPAPNRQVRTTALELHLFDSEAEAYEAFVDGDVHWAAVPLAKTDEAAARYGREHFRSYLAELFYAFNLRSPKWADRRLREAVVRAVDASAIISDVYGGSMAPMKSLVVNGVPGAPPDTCGELCVHDPARSRALLAELASAGTSPPEVFVDFEGDEAQTAVAEHIAADLEAVGLTVTLRPKPFDEYERFAVSGEQDLFRFGWIAAYPSSDAFLAPLFVSGSANNLPGFGVGAVDELIRQARATADDAQRAVLFEQVERAVFAEVPIVPIGQFRQHWVADERVRDLQLSVSGTFDAATVWLADG